MEENKENISSPENINETDSKTTDLINHSEADTSDFMKHSEINTSDLINPSDNVISDSDVSEKEKENDEKKEAKKPNFFSRTFGEGSHWGGVFNLCILSLGTGCLSLPQKIGIFGLANSPVIIVIGGLANIWTLLLISAMSEKYGIRVYSTLVHKLYGKPLCKALDIIIVINQFGYVLLYQVVLYKLIGGIINDIGGYGFKSIDDFLKNSFWRHYYVKFPVNYGICAVILLPLCILKEVSKMSIFSTLGIATLMVLVLIIIAECPFFIKYYFEKEYKKDDPSTHLNIFDITRGINGDMEFLKSLATLIYAYACQAGAMPIINSLKDKSKKHVDKVFTTSILIDMVVYLVVGITGYLTQPLNTPDLIIERRKIFDNDFVMIIGRIAFIITLIPKICNNYNALRVSMLTLLKYDTKKYPNHINWIITLTCLICTSLIASLYQSISDYISLIGSFCSVFVAMVIPGLCYIKSNEFPLSHYKNVLTIIFVVVLSLFGITSGAFTIKTIIQKNLKK